MTLSLTTIHNSLFIQTQVDFFWIWSFDSHPSSLRLSQYCKLNHMIAKEKNKYEGLMQIAVQTIVELKEQLKLQENEAQIQRSIVISKDKWAGMILNVCWQRLYCNACVDLLSRSLTKAHVKINNSSKMRDKLRNDISKVSAQNAQQQDVLVNWLGRHLNSKSTFIYLLGCFDVSSDQSGFWEQ